MPLNWALKLCKYLLFCRSLIGLFPYLPSRQRKGSYYIRNERLLMWCFMVLVVTFVSVIHLNVFHFILHEDDDNLFHSTDTNTHNMLIFFTSVSLMVISLLSFINSSSLADLFESALSISKKDELLQEWRPLNDYFFLCLTFSRLLALFLLLPSLKDYYKENEVAYNWHQNNSQSEILIVEKFMLPVSLGGQVIIYTDLLYFFSIIQISALKSLRNQLQRLSCSSNNLNEETPLDTDTELGEITSTVKKKKNKTIKLDEKSSKPKKVYSTDSAKLQKINYIGETIPSLMQYQNAMNQFFAFPIIIIIGMKMTFSIGILYFITSHINITRKFLMTTVLFTTWAGANILQIFHIPDLVFKEVS